MKILLSLPMYSGKKETFRLFPETEQFLSSFKKPNYFKVVTQIFDRQPIHIVRNKSLERAYKEWFDYVLYLDEDNPPCQLDFIDILLKKDADCVSWIVPIYNKEPAINIYKLKRNEQDREYYIPYTKIEQDIEPDSVWCGCVLINRSTIVTMWETYKRPFESKAVEYVKYDNKRYEFGLKTLHMMTSKPEDVWISWRSEDILFFERAKSKWLTLLATPDVTCKHIKYNKWERVVLQIT